MTVADGRSCDREQGARAAARQAARTGIRNLLPAHACAYQFFSGDLLEHVDLKLPVGDHLLQPAVLLLELPQALHIGGLQRAEVLPPAVDRLGADPVLLCDLRHRPLVGLPEDRHHLLFGERVFFMAPPGPEDAILSSLSWSEKRQAGHWDSYVSTEVAEALRDLAYDLDFYEPDPVARAEDPSYFAEDRAIQEIIAALGRINRS